MTGHAAIILAITVALIVIFLVARTTRNRELPGREPGFKLPAKLESAKLVLCEPEENLCVTQPFRMHGRPDEVYLKNGVLVPLDTKERNFEKVYDDDVIKLSAYGSILRNHHKWSRYKVSPYGYLRIRNRKTGRVSFAKVKLMSDRQLKEVKRRRDEVAFRGVTARTSENKNFCKGCAQRSRCPRPAA